MNEEKLNELLTNLRDQKISIAEATKILRKGPLKNDELEFFSADHHRSLRMGFGEVVYSESKTIEHLLEIAKIFNDKKEAALFTRLKKKQFKEIEKAFPSGRGNKLARTFILNSPEEIIFNEDEPFVSIVCAGTSDIPVLEEAAETCVAMQTPFKKITDVGVAGLHRVLGKLSILQNSTAVIVVAGMEGALPSVIGGLVNCPVFAVPTSVGYGASLKGISALLGMLNSCAPGVTVVNIDNGFSAAFAACQVIKMVKKIGNIKV